MITSVQNETIKKIMKLKQKKYRDEENLFLVEGFHLVEEAKKAGCIQRVIATSENLLDQDGLLVSQKVMEKLAFTKTPQPIMAICRKPSHTSFQPSLERYLLLDGIQDPGNLGTIIRTALAFGYDQMILSPECVDLYNDKVIRASEGLLFGLNIIKSDLKTIIKKLKENNYKIYSTNCKEGLELKKVNFAPLSAIIIGNEGRGMKPDLTSLCDEMIHIKIDGESLNAAVAASIIFYEVKNGKRINK